MVQVNCGGRLLAAGMRESTPSWRRPMMGCLGTRRRKFYQTAKKTTAVFILPAWKICESGRILKMVPDFFRRHTGCLSADGKVGVIGFGWGTPAASNRTKGGGSTPAVGFLETDGCVCPGGTQPTRLVGFGSKPDREWKRRRRLADGCRLTRPGRVWCPSKFHGEYVRVATAESSHRDSSRRVV
jgi:hypothetical protein